MQKTLKNLMVEYGTVAVVVYLILFFAVWIGFWSAMRFGWQPTSTAGNVGLWTAAYIATKITQPLRIAATVIGTPFIARWYERVRGRPSASREEVARDEQQV